MGAITRMVAPKVRQSLQGDWWVIDGVRPVFKFNHASSAVHAARAINYSRGAPFDFIDIDWARVDPYPNPRPPIRLL